jgi:hypothetical protein
MKFYRNNEKGQTVVIILLVMVVGLTIGLSIVNRSLSDIKISQETEQSQRAFSAAEAGLEKAISEINTLDVGKGVSKTINDVTYTVDKSLSGGGSGGYKLIGKSAVKQDDVAQVNLENESGGCDVGSVKIFWAKRDETTEPDNPCTAPVASLEISQINYNANTKVYSIYKYAYSACPGKGNDFSNATHEASDPIWAYSADITLSDSSNAKILRIRPLFNGTSLQIVGNVNLPNQEIVLTSKGELNGKVRAIEWKQPIKPALPAIFDYVLFNESNNSLSK